MASLKPQILELIRHTSCGLPEDVLDALARARDGEEEGSRAWSTFELMIENVEAARAADAPICQDTGTLIFYVDYGPDHSAHALEKDIVAAVRQATKKSWLRPNSVDSITGENSGDNTGPGSPYIHFHARKEKGVRIRLMMKGGGSENMGAQYSLPDERIGAGRDLDGVRRCVIDAVQKAQGFGCSPGTIGVGIGGDRITSYIESKEQLFRDLVDENPNPTLAALEADLSVALQRLNIGPMGFGGKTTVLGVKIGARNRVPASFFVSITYMCWAYRKGTLEVKGNRALLAGRPLPMAVPARKVVARAGAAKTGRAGAKKFAGSTKVVAAKKTAGTKVAAKKTVGTKVAAKKTVGTKVAAKKTVGKKTAAKKPVAKKVTVKKSSSPAAAIPSRRATSRRKLPVL